MINYVHKTHPRARSLKIKIERSGEVVVVTPRFTPQFLVRQFVNHNQNWIQQKLNQIRHNSLQKNNEVTIFGQSYLKKIAYSNTQPIGISLRNEELILNPIAKPEQDEWNNPRYDQKLQRFLKAAAEHYIITRTAQLADKMGIRYGRITMREQKTRWGSCSSQGNLNFNWRLVHFEPKIIDYVIIHELAHRTYMDHSSSFWRLVEKYDPEYRNHRGYLKRHGMSLG